MFIHANNDCHHMIFVSYFAVVATPTPRYSMNAPKFKGWHYDAFAGVVPRWRIHGRDLEKTIPTPIINFESINSILSSHVHFPSATLTAPISMAIHSASHLMMSP
ncbi:uncharacterized protein ARMOST_20847 [Armillaria ostoyae]|uniref:Uncharacterized protein n=1 Tax=Armillaria ostoyae TaxID=47428 RepID=A0A284S8I6_ARMOS|nr:uncharacterized protein ARMOST_20847 [Armillaria ostoyae]